MNRINYLLLLLFAGLSLLPQVTLAGTGTALLSQLDTTCYGRIEATIDSINNTITLEVTDLSGTAPFTYQWSNGATTPSIQATPGIVHTVIVTDAGGCTFVTQWPQSPPPSCSLTLYTTYTGPASAVITANADGTAPFNFTWSNGTTHSGQSPTANISVDEPGVYTVQLSTGNGCNATATTVVAFDSTGTDSLCSGQISILADSLTNEQIAVVTQLTGVAPFSFQWSNGATTQQIDIETSQNYSVTVIDATGCQFQLFWTSNAACGAYITAIDSFQSGQFLYATSTGGQAPYTYLWSTGATTNGIWVDAQGQYTVTVTDANGCTTVESISIVIHPLTLSGTLLFSDPSDAPATPLTPMVYAYKVFPGTTIADLVDSTEASYIDSMGMYWFHFDVLERGHYLLRIDPKNADYFPIYHDGSMNWDQAAFLPLFQPLTVAIQLQKVMQLQGPGGINGTVEGSGFTRTASGARGGQPLNGALVLLKQTNGTYVTFTKTDAKGQFSFNQLPLGTYELQLEQTGKPGDQLMVTLTNEQPVADLSTWKTTSTSTIATTWAVAVSPNPAQDAWTVQNQSASSMPLQLFNAQGMLLWKGQIQAYGTTSIPAQNLESGCYWLSSPDQHSKVLIKE